tara:strand:+ start:1832 stop:2209 length:378 start_codon:yes stop_codon:yes gene_type:complete
VLAKDKNKDNIIIFPKIPKQRNKKAEELDAKRQEMLRQTHNKIFVNAIAEELQETILLRLKDELVGKLTNPTFLKDYKMLSEALHSLLYRQVHMKHKLQDRVDKAITTKGKGKDLYAITIDYDKF